MQTQPGPLQNLLATLTQAATQAAPNNRALALSPPAGTRLPAMLPERLEPAVTVSPPASPLLKGRPRTGAVASLPKEERDMVCRMVAKGVPYSKIAQAVRQLGFQITERNVCNWVTHGGYAEWVALYDEALQTSLRQDDLLEHHRNQNSPELAEVGLQSAALRISELLLRQTAANHEVESNFSKLAPVVTLLCRINKELFTLQKYRDDCQEKIYRKPARIHAEHREKLMQTEAQFSAGTKPKLADQAPRANPSPAASEPEPDPAATQSLIADTTTDPAPESRTTQVTESLNRSADTPVRPNAST